MLLSVWRTTQEAVSVRQAAGWQPSGGDLLGPGLGGGVAQAELAEGVPAPAPQRAVRPGRTGVVPARADGGPGGGRGLGHLLGHGLVAERADAEPAVAVEAPAPQGPAGACAAGEVLAVGHRGPAGDGRRGDLLGHVRVGGAADAELAEAVAAPAPQGSVGPGGAGVARAAVDGGPAGGRGRGDLLRQALAGGVADAELAFGVVAPAPQGCVGAGGADVVVAGADGGPAAGRRGRDLPQCAGGVRSAPQRAIGAGGADVVQ